MKKLKPELLKKNGKEFVLLTREDYNAFSEMIDDARDVLLIREARERNKGAKGITIEELKRRLGITKPRRVRSAS
jgi:PHD/YefM family antitoxin component YafN of YafNO toxin-antitoxin module